MVAGKGEDMKRKPLFKIKLILTYLKGMLFLSVFALGFCLSMLIDFLDFGNNYQLKTFCSVMLLFVVLPFAFGLISERFYE